MSTHMARIASVAAIATGLLAAACFAQEAREPVKAPYGDALVKQEMTAHPEIIFLGLHVTPPGRENNLIVACSNPDKIGLQSTAADMVFAQPHQAKVFSKPGRNDYEVDLWFGDKAGRTLGMLVVHLNSSAVKDENGALQCALRIQKELQDRIPDRDQLFKQM